MKALMGNTYDHRETIKAKGGKWNSKEKVWYVPDEHIDELSALCSQNHSKKFRRYECEDCCDTVYSGSTCLETGLIH